MRRVHAGLFCCLLLALGCKSWFHGTSHKIAAPTFSEYHYPAWRWEETARVLVLPVLNESEYTRAGDEVRASLSGELQKLGRFEVVNAPADDRAVRTSQIHRTGRFDEGDMIELGRKASADVVLHVTITHYSPYPRPRLGLIVQGVSPAEARVIAAVDGMWDSTDTSVADRVRGYYRQKNHERPPFVRNHVIASDDSFSEDLALESPALFQRFVCREVSLVLLGLPVPGISMKPKWSRRNQEPGAMMHGGRSIPVQFAPLDQPLDLALPPDLGYKPSRAPEARGD